MKRSQTSSLGKAPSGKFLALSGGVGGAKLALGLHRLLAPPQLTVVVNTGDDFEHLGLHIAPDLDTVMYVLAGVCSGERGWGRSGDSWTFMEAISELGEEDWFRLGDKDLATHVLRTFRLARGDSLSSVTADLCRRFGLNGPIIPMSDEAVRTMVQTDLGELPFQEYFVKQKCRPQVRGFRFDGADRAQPNPTLLECCRDPELAAVIICPSNPFVSVDPLLSIPGAREAIAGAAAPKIAVSPIVAGQAVKGPLAKMMSELGLAPPASRWQCIMRV